MFVANLNGCCPSIQKGPGTMSPVNSRREMLTRASCGFGALALQAMLADTNRSTLRAAESQTSPFTSTSLLERPTMFAPRAKRIIFVFMQGGPSHVDSFDYKPDLIAKDGQSIDFTGVRFGDFGQSTKQKLMKPLWRFQQYGQTGKHVSDLFPLIGQHVDDLCFLHGVHTEGVAHGPATLFLHTGATTQVRPSMGSWILYGLGTENQSLPGFVSLQPSDANGGPRNYSNAFLPAVCQGTSIGRSFQPASQMTIDFIRNAELTQDQSRRRYSLTQQMNQLQSARNHNADDEVNAVIRNYELAWRMQAQAPEILDLSKESEATAKMYGIGEKETDEFGKQCLMARRLSESGVRFVQVNYSDQSTNPRWDQHSNMPQHAIHAKATDKPVAGLLQDLKQRGLLEDTIVWWGGEFGRTPFSQGSDGRDHNPRGFTVFLAGGGVKPGFSWGTTDEIGHLAVEGKVHMHDLHATLLHLLGVDHERLTFEHAGRNFRPTDVYGRIVQEIIKA
jgi:hypothetical protein